MSVEETGQDPESFVVFFQSLTKEPQIFRHSSLLHVRLGPYQVICNYSLVKKLTNDAFPPWMVSRMRIIREHGRKNSGRLFGVSMTAPYAPATFHATVEAAMVTAWEEVARLLLAEPGLEVSCEENDVRAAGQP